MRKNTLFVIMFLVVCIIFPTNLTAQQLDVFSSNSNDLYKNNYIFNNYDLTRNINNSLWISYPYSTYSLESSKVNNNLNLQPYSNNYFYSGAGSLDYLFPFLIKPPSTTFSISEYITAPFNNWTPTVGNTHIRWSQTNSTIPPVVISPAHAVSYPGFPITIGFPSNYSIFPYLPKIPKKSSPPDTSLSAYYSINFCIREIFKKNSDGPLLNLSVSTDKEYPCCNYSIDGSMQINDNIIKVTLKGIVKPDICLTAFGPATFTRDLNLNNGIYTLEFHSGTGIDKYSLDVSDDAINITPINTNFSSVKQPSIKKTPDNLIWAECYYNGDYKYDPKDDNCGNFFQELESIAQPYLTGDQEKTPKNQFYHYYGDDDQALMDLVEKYVRKTNYIYISTCKGNKYFCSYYSGSIPLCSTFAATSPKLEVQYLSEEVTDISECNGNTICMRKVAFFTKDESICDLMEGGQGQCYGEVGIAKLEESLCALTGKCYTCAKECYSYIAIQKNKPNLCENINNAYNRNLCYGDYIGENNDESNCYEITDSTWREKCLDKFK